MNAIIPIRWAWAGLNAAIFYLPEPVQSHYPRLLQYMIVRLQQQYGASLLECVPSYHSLLIEWSSSVTGSVALSPYGLVLQIQNWAQDFVYDPENFAANNQPCHRIPVCYDAEFALDLVSLAQAKNLSPERVVEYHCASVYQVYTIGFIPGFAYLGYVDERIRMSRLENPRAQVAAGSVGIADQQTGIYPIASPAGWQIIGRTPLCLYDPDAGLFSVFNAGDSVQFYPISKAEYHELASNNQTEKGNAL